MNTLYNKFLFSILCYVLIDYQSDTGRGQKISVYLNVKIRHKIIIIIIIIIITLH
jgi:hypothetical protein